MCSIVCPEVFRMKRNSRGAYAVARSVAVPDVAGDMFRIAAECCASGAIRTEGRAPQRHHSEASP
jgi:ferredoxin